MLSRVMPAPLLALVALLLMVSTATAAPTPRIIGGDDAANGEYPFMAALVSPITAAANRDSDFDTQFCGGSIIAARWILTAAHCVTEGGGLIDLADIAVITGVTVLDDAAGSAPRTAVTAIIRHPAYNDGTLANDVALLQLAADVATDSDFTLYRSNILPAPVLGTDLTAIGWGAVDNVPNFVPELQEVVLDFIPFAACNEAIYYDGELDPGMTCAGFLAGPPRDSCGGDSGGPLVYDIGGIWHQVGITSFGDNLCADEFKPGVYAEVSEFTTFIDGAQTAPDLRITISTVPGTVSGRQLTARLTVRNNSPVITATGIDLALTRSGTFTIDNADDLGDCSGDLDCPLPDLAPGASLTRDLELTFAGAGPYTLTAEAGATEGDYYPDNNTAVQAFTRNAGGGGGGGGGAIGGGLLLALLAAGFRRSP